MHTPHPGRYDTVAAGLHAAMAVLLLGQLAFGFLLPELAPRGSPARGTVINLHKSLGLLLLALALFRLCWRLTRGAPPPAWVPAPAWQARAVAWGHAMLYLLMLALPLAGWVASNFSRHGVRLFGLRIPPWGPDLPAVYQAFSGLHVVLAWAMAAAVAGHVLMALWHGLVRRDGSLQRMAIMARG